LKKIFCLILLAWGSNNTIAIQVRPAKSKSPVSNIHKKNLASNKLRNSKVIAKKTINNKKVDFNKSKPIIISQINERTIAINKAKDFFLSGFLLQTFRLLNQYHDAPEMDADAYRYLAECERTIGNGIETDYGLAEKYFLKSIEIKSHKNAYLSLGQIYELGGFKLNRDPQKALHYFQKAADENLSFAKFELGRLYFQGLSDSLRNEKKGILLLEEAGNQEVAEAQWMLGSIYSKGYNGIIRDMPKAKMWFKKYKENKTINQESKF
jgi:Sel1 repeat